MSHSISRNILAETVTKTINATCCRMSLVLVKLPLIQRATCHLARRVGIVYGVLLRVYHVVSVLISFICRSVFPWPISSVLISGLNSTKPNSTFDILSRVKLIFLISETSFVISHLECGCLLISRAHTCDINRSFTRSSLASVKRSSYVEIHMKLIDALSHLDVVLLQFLFTSPFCHFLTMLDIRVRKLPSRSLVSWLVVQLSWVALANHLSDLPGLNHVCLFIWSSLESGRILPLLFGVPTFAKQVSLDSIFRFERGLVILVLWLHVWVFEYRVVRICSVRSG